MTTPRLLRSPRLALAGAAIIGSSLLAACGSTSSTSTSSASKPSGTSAASTATQAKFTSCLESNGVPTSVATKLQQRGGGNGGPPSGGAPPSGASGERPTGQAPSGGGQPPSSGGQSGGGQATATPSGVSSSVWTKAMTACRSLLPTPSGSGAGGPSAQA